MEPTQNDSRTALPSDGLVPLESVLCTEELNRRPSRPPDYEAENRALAALAQALANSPRAILQTLADKILEVFQSDSAGISLLTKEDGGKRFYWPAIAGVWKPHIGGGTPRDFGPCGDVLDRNAALLFRHFERRYTYFLPVTPPVEECLLVPFYVKGKAVGTIWAITHDDRRKFDAEDLRQLESLGQFASAAYQTVEFLDALEQQSEVLRQNHTELAGRMAKLQQSNTEARDARRAALNLMEDAVQSRQLVETLNLQLRGEIAERKQAEDTLRRAMEFDEAVMSNMGEGLYTVDNQGRLTKMNPAAETLLGWTVEELRGKKVHDLMHYKHPDGSPFPTEECAGLQVLRNGKALKDFEDTFVRKDGSLFPVSYSSSPLRDHDGQIVGLVVVFQDITERKQAQEALRRNKEWLENTVAERTKELHESNLALLRDMEERAKLEEQLLHAQKMESVGTLAGGVAHDFNNLLAIIMTHAAELKNEGLNPQEFSESIDAVLTASKRGATVVRELLTFARKTSVSPDTVKLADLLLEFARMIERTFPKTIEFKLDVQPDLPTIPANANQIQQALLNLCINSRDAMPEGGKLAIGAAREMRSEAEAGDYVRISVADSGVGMDAAVRRRVFEPFFTTKEKQGGTGLGLAVTYGIVRNHGGFVEVDSAKGKGTEFRLYFPVRSENASIKEGKLEQ